MPGLLPDVDPDGLLEYSVVYTDRALNHMSRKFVGVMQEIIAILQEAYHADAVALVPGSGTFGMEAVARQFAQDRKVLIGQAPRLQHGVAGRDRAHLQDLRPAVAEPAVADHQGLFAGGELAGDRLHAEGAAAGHDGDRVRVIDLLQRRGQFAHDALEGLRHVVE